MADRDCVFCRIASKEIPAKVVFEDEHVMAFEDLNPQAPVHVLVIPKIHTDRVSGFSQEQAEEAGRMVLAASKVAREKGIEKSGYRLVLNCNKDAGQEVFHVHLHLLGGRKFGWPPG